VLTLLASFVVATLSLATPPPASAPGQAQKPAPPPVAAEEPGEIQDNSFLVEEAYNQEPGVVQHINTLQRDLRGANWYYTFTQEWPVPGEKHQLSFTLPVLALEEPPGAGAGLGDVVFNYRYQLVGSGETRVAVAPRFSILLPTGNEKYYRGGGGIGYQVNVPLSVMVLPKLAAHTNAGFTYVPAAKDAASDSAATTAFNLGQSLIWLAKPRFNVMLEMTYTHAEVVTGPGQTEIGDVLLVSPGIRWAYNFKNGLQIVPGLAFPMGVGPSVGLRSVFLYLSFEHPMWRPR
jgi:hypothetical protein